MSIGKSAERMGKKLLAIIFKTLIRSEEISLSEIVPEKVKRVLIVHQDRRIGNFILSTPLFEAASNTFPNASLDILVGKNIKILAEDNPFLKSVYIFDHKKYIKNPFSFLNIISSLRKNKYNVTVESSNPAGTSFLNGWIT